MLRKTSLILCLHLVLIFSLVGCSKDQGGMPPTLVESMPIEAGTIALRTDMSGRVSALYVSDVRPQVGGIIKERFFEEGSMVKEGQVLYQIDPALYEADYQNAKATARVAELLAKRYGQLVKAKAVSQQEYDNANADYLRTKAILDSAKINLDYTKVTAPVSGRIGRSSVTKGALVTAHQPAPLALIQQVDSMYVDVNQASFDAMRLRQLVESGGVGSVQLIFQDDSVFEQNGVPVEGRLEFVDITVDEGTDMVSIRFVFPNDEKRSLLPGMYVTIQVSEKPITNAVLVPQKTVARDAHGNYVASVLRAPTAEELAKGQQMFGDLAQKMQVVEKRSVKVNRTIGVNQYYISEGLALGETLLYSGFQKTTQGSLVLARPVADQTAPEGAR